MELRLQAKLLRVLQEGVVEPVGSNRRMSVDVRVVSSTHRDLEARMASGEFREDLFYRLNVFRVELPALRDRRGDIPALASAFLAEFGRELGRGALGLSEAAASRLRDAEWRGNVRELRNLMERAAVLAEGPEVDEGLVRSLLAAGRRSGSGGPGTRLSELRVAVEEAERRAILRALAETGDNKALAAERLGIASAPSGPS